MQYIYFTKTWDKMQVNISMSSVIPKYEYRLQEDIMKAFETR